MSAFTKIIAGILGLTMLAPVAFAREDESRGGDDDVVVLNASTSVQTGQTTSVKAESRTTVESDDDDDAVENEDESEDLTEDADDDRVTGKDDDEGDDDGDDNRAIVAAQVQALLQVADRDRGIGKEVRDIARTFASSSERIHEKKKKVEDRSALLEFLIGADWDNLGELRSELVTTENAIDRLTKAREKAADAQVKATLDVQITALAKVASSTEAYIEAHEEAFSVFGWFFKIFS